MIRVDQTWTLDQQNKLETKDHVWTNVKKKPVIVSALEMTEDFDIHTLEGIISGRAGDFVIRGIKGELYPCRRDIFLASYENV